MSVIDEIKQKTDIVAVVSQYVRLTKAGQTFRALCPFHSEKHPSFFVYPNQQTWHCFGACNTGGDAFSFIMKKEGIDFREALRLLADRAGVTLSARSEQELKGKDPLYQVNQSAAQFYHNLLLNSPAAEKARQYLSHRGLRPQTISDFQLGFAPDSWESLKQELMKIGYSEAELLATGLIILVAEKGETHDRFRDKIVFPIWDERGRVTGFGARVLDDSLPKYINSPQTPLFDKSSSLYGINLAREAIRKQDLAIIVEGYMDVIIAHQYSLNNVIAAMGTSITEKQLITVRKLTKNVALALDADAAGEDAWLQFVGYENAYDIKISLVILPTGRDPDEVIKEDAKGWQQLVQEATPVDDIDYVFDTVASKINLTTAKGKALVANKLLPIIAEIKDDIRQDHYLNKLAEMTGTLYRNLESALSRIKPDRRARETRAETMAHALTSLLSHPIEDNCLALLLQHPELKGQCQTLSAEYFESSPNREIFIAYQQTNDLPSLRESLDSSIHEHLDSMLHRSLRSTQIEQRWQEYTLRLREKYLRRLAWMKKEVLASEAATGGAAAELAKLEEQGIEDSIQLGEVFTQRGRSRSRAKGGEK